MFSLYEDPAICALCTPLDGEDDLRALVGGDEFGFLWWLDRREELYCGLGRDAAYGSPELVVGSDCEATEFAVPIQWGQLDLTLEGARGLKLRYGAESDDWCWVVGSVDSMLHTHSAIPRLAAGAKLLLGAQEFLWESRWFDFQSKEHPKRPYSIDLEVTSGSTGQIILEYFGDLRDGTIIGRSTEIDLSIGSRRYEIPIRAKQSRWYKVRVRSVQFTAGAAFEITSLTWRSGGTGQS